MKPMSAFAGPPSCAAHRLRQRVVGAMRERVAVDDEERPHARLRSSSAIASREPVGRDPRRVARPGARRDRRSRSAGRRRPGAARAARAAPSRRSRPERAARRPRARSARHPAPTRLVLLPQALSAAASLPGTSRRRCPSRASSIAVAIASSSCSPRRTLKAPPALMIQPERKPEQLGLRHEAKEATREEGHRERPGIEVRPVVRGEHETTRARDVLDAPRAVPKQRP